jgi:hypothetical protein
MAGSLACGEGIGGISRRSSPRCTRYHWAYPELGGDRFGLAAGGTRALKIDREIVSRQLDAQAGYRHRTALVLVVVAHVHRHHQRGRRLGDGQPDRFWLRLSFCYCGCTDRFAVRAGDVGDSRESVDQAGSFTRIGEDDRKTDTAGGA